jgi:hypothetical protein
MPGSKMVTVKSWKKLFLFCMGLVIGTAFCMKWMENDLSSKGEQFSILGLELFYTKEKMTAILSGLDGSIKTILQYHLSFDFAFMAGVYPGITSLCMIAKEKTSNTSLKKLLYILAAFQLLAWAADITENYYLLKWTSQPVMGNDFSFYHFVVWSKWIIAFSGLFLSLIFVFRKTKNNL